MKRTRHLLSLLFGSRMITKLHDPAKLKPSWLWFGGDLLLEEPVSFQVIVLSILTKPHPFHTRSSLDSIDRCGDILLSWTDGTARFGEIVFHLPAQYLSCFPFRVNSQDQSRKILLSITCIGLLGSCCKILTLKKNAEDRQCKMCETHSLKVRAKHVRTAIYSYQLSLKAKMCCPKTRKKLAREARLWRSNSLGRPAAAAWSET